MKYIALLLLAVATGFIGTRVVTGHLIGTQGQKAISLARLQPPISLVPDMAQLLGSDRGGARQGPASEPLQNQHRASSLWGYYLNAANQPPYRGELEAQLRDGTGVIGWPPLPFHGDILRQPAFQSRILEIYIAADLFSSDADASVYLKNSQRAASDLLGTDGEPCAQGSDCRAFSSTHVTPPSLGTSSLQHLWRWRVGRIVLSVSALGADGWPATQANPLLDYEAGTAAALQHRR